MPLFEQKLSKALGLMELLARPGPPRHWERGSGTGPIEQDIVHIKTYDSKIYNAKGEPIAELDRLPEDYKNLEEVAREITAKLQNPQEPGTYSFLEIDDMGDSSYIKTKDVSKPGLGKSSKSKLVTANRFTLPPQKPPKFEKDFGPGGGPAVL